MADDDYDDGQPPVITVSRNADPNFTAVPVIYFRVVTRQSSRKAMLKRVCTITPRGMLYLCDHSGRATRSLFLGSVTHVGYDQPSLVMEARDTEPMLLNCSGKDDLTHPTSTFEYLLSLCQYFSPECSITQQRLANYDTGAHAVTEAIDPLGAGLVQMKSHAPGAAPDRGASSPQLTARYHGGGSSSHGSVSALRGAQRRTPQDRPLELQLPPEPDAPRWYLPPSAIQERLAAPRKPPKTVPRAVRADADFLAMMAFFAVADASTAGLSGAADPTPSPHLFTVATTGIATLWRSDAARWTGPVSDCVTAAHVESPSVVTLTIQPRAQALRLELTDRFGDAMTQLLAALMHFALAAPVAIDAAPSPQRATRGLGPAQPGRGAAAGGGDDLLRAVTKSMDEVAALQRAVDAEAAALRCPALQPKGTHSVALAQLIGIICERQRALYGAAQRQW